MDRVKLIGELVRDECIDGKPALKPYRDSVRSKKYPAGILTIGIGRNLEDVGITADEAYFLCHNDITGVQGDLDGALPWWGKLDDVRQRVLVNMCFNMGITRLMNFKKMLGAALLLDWDRAAGEMKDSEWYGQTGHRAERLERAMLTGVMP
jgi:lysozyme